MNSQFTKGAFVQCEFREWDGTDSRSKVCGEEAKKYTRKDGKRFDIIEGGKIKENSKRMMRLCDYHYEEMCKVVELEEAELERQFS